MERAARLHRRVLVCLTHAGFTGVALSGQVGGGRAGVLTIALAMACHFTVAGVRPRALMRPGPTRCPGCAALHPSPLFRCNLLDRRFERCPACRRWHVVPARDDAG